MNPSRASIPLLVALLVGCAPLSRMGGGSERADLWRSAHWAFLAQRFQEADSIFSRLTEHHSDSQEGREAHFYLGTIRMDPRNPGWDSGAAAAELRLYLAEADSADPRAIGRRPEATTLLELASQLNLPPSDRIAALQPDTVMRTRTVSGAPRRIVSAEESRALGAEVDRLRGMVRERDETIRRQREELNRIRNTLAPSGRRP
ncbi:MAG: hypothetical protein M3483_01570 [Gemmatimonadota bacterium]|nr:hypothetical protein [Gemmatimonadota bacterium]